jgi:hypothetical protein
MIGVELPGDKGLTPLIKDFYNVPRIQIKYFRSNLIWRYRRSL